MADPDTDDLLAQVMQADAEWQAQASEGDYSDGTDYWLTVLAAPLAEVERLQAELEAQKAIAEQTYHLMGVEIDRLRAVSPAPSEGP